VASCSDSDTVEAVGVGLAVELDPPLPDEQAAATTATTATIRSRRLGPCIAIASQDVNQATVWQLPA
jgi:hypothetical protein